MAHKASPTDRRAGVCRLRSVNDQGRIIASRPGVVKRLSVRDGLLGLALQDPRRRGGPVAAQASSSRPSASGSGRSSTSGSDTARLLYSVMPVPAEMRCPMITFSFRLRSSSRLLRVAASVSTRVVSWKLAALMKRSVVRLALVMPSSSGSKVAGSSSRLARSPQLRVLRPDLDRSRRSTRLLRHLLAFEEGGVAGDEDQHLLEHARDDDLDVLVVDLHALQPVDLLDRVDQVGLHGVDALDGQDVHRVDRPLGEAVARHHALPLVRAHVLAVRDEVFLLRRPSVAAPRRSGAGRASCRGTRPCRRSR